jgi:ribosomal protein L10
MDRSSKEAFVSKVKESIEVSPGALFLDYTGMTVNDINAVWRKF